MGTPVCWTVQRGAAVVHFVLVFVLVLVFDVPVAEIVVFRRGSLFEVQGGSSCRGSRSRYASLEGIWSGGLGWMASMRHLHDMGVE